MFVACLVTDNKMLNNRALERCSEMLVLTLVITYFTLLCNASSSIHNTTSDADLAIKVTSGSIFQYSIDPKAKVKLI